MSDFKKLLQRVKTYRKEFILSILSNVLMSVFTVISIPTIIPFFQILFGRESSTSAVGKEDRFTAFFSNLIVDYGQDKALILVCGLIISIFFFKNVFRYLAMYFMIPLRTGIVRDIRKDLFDKYIHLPLSYHSDQKTGDMISRITMDVQEVEISILKFIEVIFKAPLIIIGSIIFMLYISPQLSLFVLILLVFTIVVIGGISRTLKSKSTAAQQSLGRLTNIVEESVSGVKIIKAFGAEENQKTRFSNENNHHRNVLKKILYRQNLSSPLSEFLGITVVTALLWFGSQLVLDDGLNPETFFAFIFAFYQVIDPAKSLSSAFYNIQKGMAAYDRIDELIQLQEENTFNDSNIKYQFEEELIISNVSFRFDEDQNVLDNISLAIKKGEQVALVGASGSGKTTLADILLRFYEFSSGRILLDGQDINTMNLSGYRNIFGFVSQHAMLFNESIIDNIRFGNKSIPMESVIQAAKIANAHDFIVEQVDGYDTVIGDKGHKLSGGQRQRITIARAILHDPQILILDEATSALDSDSEKLVQEALDHVLQGRTAIIIAHRLSTIKNVDKIFVLEKGQVIGEGNHSDLYKVSPIYKRYVDMQSA